MKLTDKMVRNLHKATDFSFSSRNYKGHMSMNWTDENEASCSFRICEIEADREETCECYTHSRYQPLVQAVMKQLREGDEIQYVWTPDAERPYRMKEQCNVHIDVFALRVIRDNEWLEYPLITKVTKLDDEYRMIMIPLPPKEEEQTA